MKKLLSFVMAAAMVASLVPATAFAAEGDVKATAKVVGVEKTDGSKTDFTSSNSVVPTLQLEVTEAKYAVGDAGSAEITVTLDNATWDAAYYSAGANLKSIVGNNGTNLAGVTAMTSNLDADQEEMTITVTGRLAKDDIIYLPLYSTVDKASKDATVSVASDDIAVTLDDVSYVVSSDAGFTASVKKTVKVAEEEVVTLENLVLKSVIDDDIAIAGKEMTLKLNKGFEFVPTSGSTMQVGWKEDGGATVTGGFTVDGNEAETGTFPSSFEKVEISGIRIEATTADAGDKATITISIDGMDKAKVEVAEVVDYKVVMSVDEDEDVPVIYSGVNVDNYGITDDSDHETLEITLEETFPGAWSMRQGFNITLPEGVYVTNVEVKDAENFEKDGDGTALTTKWADAFTKAYRDGDYENFEFGKRVFDDVNVTLNSEPAKMTFVLTLVADPGFEGDVKVGFEGALVDSQEVVAAKFVAPYTVKAEQNDIKIDSRYTAVDTPIVVTEAADGLWEKDDATFFFTVETGAIVFEDTASFTADNEMELKDTGMTRNDQLAFTVKTESDKAATVTIDDMELFLNRSIPEGPYDLLVNTSLETAYLAQPIFAADAKHVDIEDVCDYSDTVKEKFVNIITAPRDEDGFTTKISVPVGESYIIAGEKKVEIDTPAYINGAGYTMLPLRAVAVALGIDNNSVLWDQASRTATILYGNRVVSMQNGAKVMYINGQAVATKAGVEITNDRVFLSLRDLGTAMNVTDISWDAATRTAYLNYGGAEA